VFAAATVLISSGPLVRTGSRRAYAGESSPERDRKTGKKRHSDTAPNWERQGWKVLGYQHSGKTGITIARFLAPDSVTYQVHPLAVSLVAEVTILPPSKMPGEGKLHGAHVVWRGYKSPGGRGDEQFHTWEPFFRPLSKVPPRRASARLEYMFDHLVEPDEFLQRGGKGADVRRASAP
jgi:hypothetical protein